MTNDGFPFHPVLSAAATARSSSLSRIQIIKWTNLALRINRHQSPRSELQNAAEARKPGSGTTREGLESFYTANGSFVTSKNPKTALITAIFYLAGLNKHANLDL